MPTEKMLPTGTALNSPAFALTGAATVHGAVGEGMASMSDAEYAQAGVNGRIFRVTFGTMQSANVGAITSISVPLYYQGVEFIGIFPAAFIRLRKSDLSLIAEVKLNLDTGGAKETGMHPFTGLSLVQADIDGGIILEYESANVTGGESEPEVWG